MAATGKTPILLYGSTTPTNQPSAGNLINSSDGCEIAINVADKNLFFKDSTNVVNTVPIRQSSSTSNGWLSSTDWNTFNNKQPAGTYVTSVTGTAPVVSSGGTTPAISMAAANGSTDGYLTSTDWTTFNNKVSSQWVTTGSDIYYNTGNAGLGVSPSSWSAYRVFQISGVSGIYANSSNEFGSFQNAYYNSGWKYGASSVAASWHYQYQGSYVWNVAPSGTANAAISWTQALTLDNSANLTVNTGNLVIGTSGKGIDFSATAGTGTSELLADYEEGTFTPVVKDAAAGNAATAAAAGGFYTKVGRTVNFTIRFINVTTTGLTAGNQIYITGLPYASTNDVKAIGAYTVLAASVSSTAGTLTAYMDNTVSYLQLYNQTTTTFTNAIVSQITSGSNQIYITGTYTAT